MNKRMIHYMNFIMLILILSIGILLFWTFRFEKMAQMYVGILISVLYIGWGIVSHWLADDLHIKSVIEYLLVGVIAVTLINTIIWL